MGVSIIKLMMLSDTHVLDVKTYENAKKTFVGVALQDFIGADFWNVNRIKYVVFHITI